MLLILTTILKLSMVNIYHVKFENKIIELSVGISCVSMSPILYEKVSVEYFISQMTHIPNTLKFLS